MSFWISVAGGLLVGTLASLLIARDSSRLLRDLTVAVLGAGLVTVLLDRPASADSVPFDIFGVVATLAGACGALVVYYTLSPPLRMR